MPNPRLVTIFIILLIIFAFPDTPPSTALGGGDHRLDQAVARELAALKLLNSTQYGDFDTPKGRWLNLTGLKEKDKFAWDALDAVKSRAREQIEHIFGRDEAAQTLEGLSTASLPIYHNVSGHIRGTWVRSQMESKVKKPQLNMTALLPSDARGHRLFDRNVTGGGGNIRFDFSEKGIERSYNGIRVLDMKADVVIADDTSAGDGWSVVLYGQHFVDAGHMILTTSSPKFNGIFALPHFVLTEHLYNATQGALATRLQKQVEEQRSRKLETLNPWQSSIDGSAENAYTPHCDIIVYLQQHPVQVVQENGVISAPSSPMIESLEHELRYPAGHRSFDPPPMKMSTLIFSPDCGFMIESKGPPDYPPSEDNHLTGEKWEIYIITSVNYTLLFGVVLTLQLYLTVSQMKHSSTPSTRSRISTYTIGLLSLGDGFVGMSFLPLGMLVDSAFPALLTTAFLAFLGVAFFDVRFLLDIWSVQVQERRRQDRQQGSTTSTASPSTEAEAPQQPTALVPIITAAGADVLPLPVTSRQAISFGATPIILPPDQDEQNDGTTPAANTTTTDAANTRRELGTLYGKFYLILLGITFLSLHATSWYPAVRSAYMNILAFVYLSFWWPQIHRNVMRNCRKALLWKFIIGQSVLRLLPIAYFYTVSANILWVQPDRHAFLVLAGWVWTQVWILVIQEVLGPRLFVPSRWVPPAYDYHPILREDEEGTNMPIGFTQVTSDDNTPLSPVSTRSGADSKENKGKRIFDCAICMQNIEVSVISADAGVGETSNSASNFTGNLLARRMYMVTPCRHIFHTKCLESAMRYRLQCPICRETLPPL